jgi:hypothetical protein
MAMDEENEEFYLSVQYPPEVAVYRKQASGDEKPLRLIKVRVHGSRIHMESPSTQRPVVICKQLGKYQRLEDSWFRQVRCSFDYRLPSRRRRGCAADACNSASKTQLNWPGAMAIDPERSELYVASKDPTRG